MRHRKSMCQEKVIRQAIPMTRIVIHLQLLERQNALMVEVMVV